MSWDDLMVAAAQVPRGDPRNYLVPIEALEGQVQRPMGQVDPSNLDASRSDLSTLSPAQRAYVLAQNAKGRPAVVTVKGPPLRGGLPEQANYFPVGIPVAPSSAAPTHFAPFPNPQPPSSHSPLRDILAVKRMQASREGTFPSVIGRGGPDLDRGARVAMLRSSASRYAPNGAFDQSVKAMESVEGGGARIEGPVPVPTSIPASSPRNFSGPSAVRRSGTLTIPGIRR